MLISEQLREKISDFACTGMFSDIMDGQHEFIVINDLSSVSGRNIFGPIATVKIETIQTNDENLSLGLRYLTSLEPGMVLLVEGSDDYAYFGEMMANLSIQHQIAGAIILGRSRDMYAIKKLDFPLFHKGLTPTDIKGRGRVEAVNVPLNFEGAMVKPGQWLFADTDGIIIFDAEIVFEIANKVSDLIDHERAIVSDIQSGLTGEELAQKYDGF